VPLDPRLVVGGPLDPTLEGIRAGLQPYRRRLWLRRIVRRAWIALAAGVASDALLLVVARIVPVESLPSLLVIVGAVAIGGEADTAALDPYDPSVIVCCADTPKDVGAVLSRYAARRSPLWPFRPLSPTERTPTLPMTAMLPKPSGSSGVSGSTPFGPSG